MEDIEAYYAIHFPMRHFVFMNLGLPSETVSGLSEPGHAGGRFPRPDLHWRLARVLEKTRPDLVFACYRMNDGIYLPFDDERFQKFKDGMQWLHQHVVAAGARIIHITPPTFDSVAARARKKARGKPESSPPYDGYNQVLDRYSDWLLAQRTRGWNVVDLHGPMNHWLAAHRKQDSSFNFTREGVHPDVAGHWFIARQILVYLGARDVAHDPTVASMLSGQPHGGQILKLIQKKQRMMRNAWLSYTHYRRPGIKKGLPIREAQSRATALNRQIQALLHSEAQRQRSVR